MTGLRPLCRLDELPAGTAVGFAENIFAIRVADRVMVYLNACPHLGVALDWLPGKFMSADGQHIVCSMHGAVFRPEDGVCVRGPCKGDRLTAVPCEVRDGAVFVTLDAGKRRDREKIPGPIF